MPDKQTQCPACHRIYRVSIAQLAVAQGEVCCPKCQQQFNALQSLIELQSHEPADIVQDNLIMAQHSKYFLPASSLEQQQILNSFYHKSKDANLSLKNYLNTTNHYNAAPASYFLNLHLATSSPKFTPYRHRRSGIFYLFWALVHLSLVSILLFQLLWFNPRLLEKSVVLNQLFVLTCAKFQCDLSDKRYQQISIIDFKADHDDAQLNFKGLLLNQYDKSLKLPLLQLTIRDNQAEESMIIRPNVYLNDHTTDMDRIPSNQPYQFQFKIQHPYRETQRYTLKILPP
ncbi:DUF3426 domain-containing protein [Acinetobacter larvae]|uniref:Zinc finger/thioredoxin putative domain-containing protein n=1 Tax=Acinetobacter larvae TaxID=1789224 RepID=A0A1B2LYM9_9GAMM|nr:DUF3426 domain-containing protein [Acinetobacter larvae]AOA57989.1 hypothetical protein BFG52_06250 [Acinetobacter larvae]